MARLKVLISGILAGVCIGLSGVVLLSVESKVLGAALAAFLIIRVRPSSNAEGRKPEEA